MMNRNAIALGALALSCLAAPAYADAPEQLYEHGPEAGKFALEYNGQAGDGDPYERPHSLEFFAGLSERIAVGVEVEGEVEEGKLVVDEYALGMLVGLNDADAPVALSVLVQAGINRHGDFPQAQARLIAQHETEKWDWNGNLILRHEKGEESGSALAYATTVHHRISENVGIGLEASGQLARVTGFDDEFDAAHYLGPSLAFELENENGPSLEVGLKYLRRIDQGDAYRDTLRLSIGMEF